MNVQINTAPMYYKDPQTGQYVPVVGIQGPRGIQGIPGKGIKSIQKTGTSGQTDTYTITYDDDTTSTYQLVNEANGEAYGAGTRNGVPVTSGDPAFEKNAPYFAGLARKYTDGKGLDGTADPAFNENNANYYLTLTRQAKTEAEALLIKEKLLDEMVPDTTQAITFDQTTGNVQSITHSSNGVAVRTDVYTFGTNTITEVRTLSTGQSLTIVTNTETLATTITYDDGQAA